MKQTQKKLQLQIRVSEREKEAIALAARKAGVGMSEWVLRAALPEGRVVFHRLVRELSEAQDKSFALAEIHDLLEQAMADEFEQIVLEAPATKLSPYWMNYLAAMVELSAHRKKVPPPLWTLNIHPLDQPKYGSDILKLRLYLLTHSPLPFRRRNIFIDSSVGTRV
jgi:uncharacterized protein (DUF1778 family)